ncbi:MAG: TraB/GumN family protein, partial [Saprospiraceae bacterium]|nr:TraB/GumN family protein [Saprospiraceae bacterium]
MLRFLLPLLALFLFNTLAAQKLPEKRKGLLWEISGNGLARPGYLYGTMHVPEKLAFNLSDSFFLALQHTDMVALETDHDQWQAFTQILEGPGANLFGGFGLGISGGRYASQADLYGTSFVFELPDNQLLGAILSSKPQMTNEFLYRSNQYRQDYEEDTYLDLFIFQAGRKLGKPVIGLETLEGSYEALVRAQLPDEEDDADDPSGRFFRPGGPKMSLDDAYRDQDLVMIDSINRMTQPSKNFKRWMLDERNLIMLQRIDSILQSGTSLFSAVGAAHLPGDMGLIQLLSQKGYALRPVQFTAARSKQEMERIEQLRYPVQMSPQWAPDSSWTAEAPGKFYQTLDGSGLEQALAADMSNGAYYAAYRLHTFGAWHGQGPEYMARRIDSLLYEKIPGKIQSRTSFQTPFPGHEITTRTRRGDIMRFKLFVTPMDVFLFTTGGNGDYALGEQGTRFLNSIRLQQVDTQATRAVLIEPAEAGFRVRFPAPPLVNTIEEKDPGHRFIAASSPGDSAFYLLCQADFQDWAYIEEDTFELNVMLERIAAQFTKQTPHSHLLSAAPYPTQELSFQSERDSAWYFLRLIIEGPRYYLLACRKPGPGAPRPFFDSFAIKAVRYPGGFEEISDTALLFRARAPIAIRQDLHPFLAKLQRIMEDGYRKNRSNQGLAEFQAKFRSRYLRAPLQQEEIALHVMDLSVGGLPPTLDSFKNLIRLRFSGYGNLVLREARWESETDQRLTGYFLATDTNSVRAIRSKLVITPGRQYILSTTVQQDMPESEFVRTFFQSFTPTDTTPGQLPFGRHNLLFLQNIYASDSLAREKARAELEGPGATQYLSTDFRPLRKAIEHPEFSGLPFRYRQKLLKALGYFQTPEALSFLLEYTGRFPDSVRYAQIGRLALARMNTRPAYQALSRDLLAKPIYLSTGLFLEMAEVWDDSLELSALLFPALLRLAPDVQYRSQVLSLLANLLRKNLLRPKTYARLLPELKQEAALALSRFQAETEQKRDPLPGERIGNGNGFADYGSVSDLERNFELLAPFISKDKQVKALFDQAIRQEDKNVRMMTYVRLLQIGAPVAADALRPFLDEDETRYSLYRRLGEAGQLSRYAAWFADSVALVRSLMWRELSEGLDSARFHSRHKTQRYSRPAELYIFDVKLKKDTEWRLALVTLPVDMPYLGALQTGEDEEYRSYLQRPDVRLVTEVSGKAKEEFIQKTIGEIRYAGRRRYQNADSRPG